MNKGIFFIESPFQLLSTYEAISIYRIQEYKIVIRLSNIDQNDRQIMQVLNILFVNDINIILIKISVNNRTILDYLKILYNSCYWIFTQMSYNYIFIGNLESGFLSLLVKGIKKNKIVLLDDGIKSLLFQNTFSDDNNYNLFTMLKSLKEFKNQIIIYNNFEKLKLLSKNKKIDNNIILFIGSKLSESSIISEDYYIDLIKKISNKYKRYKLLYIPHRGENKNKLKIIDEYIDNLYIEYIDYPIEIYLLEKNIIPKNIISFYSAALVSISLMFNDVNVISYKFDYSFYKNKYLLNQLYEDLKYYVEVFNCNEKSFNK